MSGKRRFGERDAKRRGLFEDERKRSREAVKPRRGGFRR